MNINKILAIMILSLSMTISTQAFSANSSSCGNYVNGKCVYNGQVAANYAKKYVQSSTYPFHYFTDGIGGDCTNFVSQAILSGLVGSDYVNTVWNKKSQYTADRNSGYTKEWYYLSTSDRGPAWSGANKLFEYVRYNKNSYKGMHFDYKPLYATYLKVGDIIFADWDNNRTMDHTMVVTQISSGGNGLDKIFVTYHSNDTLNRSLMSILNEVGYQATFHAYRPTFYSDSGLGYKN